MTKSKKSTVKTITIMIILAGVIFCAFMYFTNRKEDAKSEQAVQQSEVEKLLAKDFGKEYPPTAREVVKRFARIVKCIYSEDLTTDEVTQLGELVLGLYSQELSDANPYDDYIEQLHSEVKEYEKLGKTVISYVVDSGNNTVTWTEDGVDYSRVLATFTTQEGTIFNKSAEEFVLKSDEEGQWKIVGWRLVDKEDL